MKRALICAAAMTLAACMGNMQAKQEQLVTQLAQAVRERASRDFGCPSDQVTATLNREVRGSWEAKGCGKSEAYRAACSGFNVELECKIMGSGKFDSVKSNQGDLGKLDQSGEGGARDDSAKPVKHPAGVWGSFMFLAEGTPKDIPAAGWENIPVLESAPTDKYRTIGIVEAIGRGLNLTVESIMPELKKQAGMMGAGAIYKIESNEFSTEGEAIYATAIVLEAKP